MAACQQFVIDKHNAAAKTQRELPTGRMRVWMVLDGSLTIRYADTAELLVRRGDTMLLPAALTNATIIVREAGTWLDITIPE
jgi:mannose-6-phosphate isomerase class I